jgi:hypothetical protein
VAIQGEEARGVGGCVGAAQVGEGGAEVAVGVVCALGPVEAAGDGEERGAGEGGEAPTRACVLDAQEESGQQDADDGGDDEARAHGGGIAKEGGLVLGEILRGGRVVREVARERGPEIREGDGGAEMQVGLGDAVAKVGGELRGEQVDRLGARFGVLAGGDGGDEEIGGEEIREVAPLPGAFGEVGEGVEADAGAVEAEVAMGEMREDKVERASVGEVVEPREVAGAADGIKGGAGGSVAVIVLEGVREALGGGVEDVVATGEGGGGVWEEAGEGVGLRAGEEAAVVGEAGGHDELSKGGGPTLSRQW